MTRVLVVDDQAELREEVSDWLEMEGYETLVACNGRQALTTALQHCPDLIVSDIAMPEMDGFQLLLELRANPELSSTPFIFLTARADHEFVRKGMGLGADDYLTKPFSHTELLNTISARLERKKVYEQTAERQFNALSQALQHVQGRPSLQGRITTMLSHDLRGLVTAVLSSAGLLKKYRDRMTNEQQNRHIDRIEGASYQIIHMLDDIFLSAELETEASGFQPEIVDLCTFMDTLIAEFRVIIDERHTITYQCDVDGRTQVDRRLFRQIVTNLLSNGVKYSPNGGEVAVTLHADGGDFILKVSDCGIGIAATDIPHLFDPFFRAQTAQPISGTGLGLPIVKYAVDLHGGSIHVSSEPGQGTCFTVTIPQSRG